MHIITILLRKYVAMIYRSYLFIKPVWSMHDCFLEIIFIREVGMCVELGNITKIETVWYHSITRYHDVVITYTSLSCCTSVH